MRNRGILMQAMVLISYLVMLILSIVSIIVPFNGISTAIKISYSFPNLFTPSVYTAIILILIYLLFGGYTVYQFDFIKSVKKMKPDRQNQIRIAFILSCVLNSMWNIAWNFGYIALTLVLIVSMVTGLVIINKILSREDMSGSEKLFIRLPFSIYYGWITIVTVSNAIILLVSFGWNRMGISKQLWMIAVIILVVVIVIYRSLMNKDVAYCLTMLWLYIGILIKHIARDELNGHYPYIIAVLIIFIIVLTGVAGYLLLTGKKSKKLAR